jgi:NAD(P)-dependent dehydrogenase (short-subunit alcohol dehydrogenase family)
MEDKPSEPRAGVRGWSDGHPRDHRAGSGIGNLIAERLATRGDRLVLVVRDAARADDLAHAFPGSVTVVADLAHPDDRRRGAGCRRHPDRIDSVIHAAGIVELGRVGDLPVSAWESQLAVNLTAPAELTRLLLPRVRAARGQVVFVNSGAGLTAHPQWAAYAASKHGLKALADALRGEEAEHGVRVTTVYPGRTATPMQAEVHAQEGGLRPRPLDPPGVGGHGRAHGARSSA